MVVNTHDRDVVAVWSLVDSCIDFTCHIPIHLYSILIMFSLLSTTVSILLTLVGFSAGVILASKRREYPLGVLDLIVAFILCVGVAGFGPELWPLLLAVAIGVGVAGGFVLAILRLSSIDDPPMIPTSELPEHARERVEMGTKRSLLRRAWDRWYTFAGCMGDVQGRLLMGFFYFIVVTPFGLGMRLFTDSLAIKRPQSSSNWLPKEQTEASLRSARDQG